MLMSCMEPANRLLYLEQQCSVLSNIKLIARCVNLHCGAWMDVCNIVTRLCGLCVLCVSGCVMLSVRFIRLQCMASSQSCLAAALQTHPTSLRLWTM